MWPFLLSCRGGAGEGGRCLQRGAPGNNVLPLCSSAAPLALYLHRPLAQTKETSTYVLFFYLLKKKKKKRHFPTTPFPIQKPWLKYNEEMGGYPLWLGAASRCPSSRTRNIFFWQRRNIRCLHKAFSPQEAATAQMRDVHMWTVWLQGWRFESVKLGQVTRRKDY